MQVFPAAETPVGVPHCFCKAGVESSILFVSTKPKTPGCSPGVFGFVGRDAAENREEVRASEPTDLFVSTTLSLYGTERRATGCATGLSTASQNAV